MNPQTTEDRVLTALLLGSATSAELAKMLCLDRVSLHRAIKALVYSRMVETDRWSGQNVSSSKLGPTKCYMLTKAGREWAEGMMK